VPFAITSLVIAIVLLGGFEASRPALADKFSTQTSVWNGSSASGTDSGTGASGERSGANVGGQ
jgi:hypothetical protein